jgi:hypothetical protein
LEHTAANHSNIDYVNSQFNDFLVRSQFNVALGLDYSRVLQLSNTEEIFNQFDLDDISRLYSSLLEIQKFNLDAFVEATNF